jgi:hypothetical protein
VDTVLGFVESVVCLCGTDFKDICLTEESGVCPRDGVDRPSVESYSDTELEPVSADRGLCGAATVTGTVSCRISETQHRLFQSSQQAP